MIKFYDLQAITMQHADEYAAATQRVIESGWFLQGNETKSFESAFAHYVGTSQCVGVANGLDALWLILRAYKELGVMHDGDEIIVPANTYIATILAITRNHLVPVLVEPTFEHLQIDASRIEQAITARTKGIMIVHLYGRVAYNEMIADLCRIHSLKLIEDCAQAHGAGIALNAEFRKCGAMGDAAAFSFYPGKNMGAMGDAGAVTTSDEELANVIRALGNYGSQQKYVFRYEGVNSRMSEIDAAILSVKLKYLDEDNAKRQQLAAYYYDHISNPLLSLPLRIADAENVYHQFPVFCERRDELQQYLAGEGIQTLIHYPIPPHLQQCYANAEWNIPRLSLPVTERIHRQELSLPMSQVLSMHDAQIIVDALNEFR